MAEDQETRRLSTSGREPAPRRRRRRRKFHPIAAIFKTIGAILLVIVTTGVLLVGFAAVYINTAILPDAREWVTTVSADVSVGLTSTMYYTDENGVDREYLTISSDENRVWVPYASIPKDLIQATVATEDKRFYDHHGVDWIRTANGVLRMFTGGRIQGGSTLTQQLIKNMTGEDQTTVKRKVTEIFRALEFDKNYSKETTLEWYLNYIFFGELCYGIHTAANMYFAKDVTQLSLAQCACLISIPNNPSRYDPYLNKDAEVTNDEALRKRAKDVVLWSMFEQGKITEDEYEKACREVDDMVFVRGSKETTATSVVYNWYQDQVLADVIADLSAKYGWESKVAANKVYYGGLSIYTNVDPRIQDIIESVYADPANLPYTSRSGQQMQSGMTIIDNATGKVVAVAGGIGEKTVNRAWSRASDTVRPVGSSMKPLGVYGPALEYGLITPYSAVDDSPYMMLNEKPYPVNAYGYYRGIIDIDFALTTSCNAAAIRTLGDLVTPQVSFNFLRDRFHITSLVEEKWVNDKKYSDIQLPVLALGGLTDGISTYEMAAAYAAFPNMGRYSRPTTYSKVVDSEGNVLLDNSSNREYILKESTCYYMNSMLKNVITSPWGTGQSARFDGMTIAGKTGTTTDVKDLYFVGYTPYYTGAVWVGYDRQEPMDIQVFPTNTLWRMVMSQVHEGLENKDFPEPSGVELVTVPYCKDSGMKPGELCYQDVRGSRVATGTFVKGDEPTKTCNLHTSITVCTEDFIRKPAEVGEDGEEKEGEPTPYNRLAGLYCPEETRKTLSVVNIVRGEAASKVTIGDQAAMLSNWAGTEPCTLHTQDYDPARPFDPKDPNTWPLDDPGFNINDPSTWPTHTGSETPGGDDEPGTGPGDDPGGVQPSPDPSHTTEDEPFVPAGPSGR